MAFCCKAKWHNPRPNQAQARAMRQTLLSVLVLIFHCFEPSCHKKFSTQNERRSHLKRKHNLADVDGILLQGEMAQPQAQPGSSQQQGGPASDVQERVAYQRLCLNHLTEWQLGAFVPKTITQTIKENVQQLHEANMTALKALIEIEVATQGKDADIGTIFAAFEKFWPGMEKQVAEDSLRKHTFKPVQGCLNVLGERWVTIDEYSGKELPTRVKVVDTCYSYPFELQLLAILNNKHLYNAIQTLKQWIQSRGSGDGMIRDLYDGQRWKNTPFFQQHIGAYTVLLYYVDVTVTNPLGSYTRKVHPPPPPKPQPTC
jgi:hypothetical protein